MLPRTESVAGVAPTRLRGILLASTPIPRPLRPLAPGALVSTTITACVVIQNRLGLHARPAMMFVEEAMRFGSEIRVRRTDQAEAVDGKSIMQMMVLAATKDTEIEVQATGDDATDAVDALVALVDSKFSED